MNCRRIKRTLFRSNRGLLRAIIKVSADELTVTVLNMAYQNPRREVVGVELHRPVTDVQGAKDKAVFSIASELGRHMEKEFETVRRDLGEWQPHSI